MLSIANRRRLMRGGAEKGSRHNIIFPFHASLVLFWLLSWVSIGVRAFLIPKWMIRLVNIIMPVRME